MKQRLVRCGITLLFLCSIAELSLLRSIQAQSLPLAELRNGNYQICSQPPPKDWRQGAGVCLVFRKQNRQIEGYYGYPHSDAFVCLRGALNGTQVVGQGYLVSWQGRQWNTSPNAAFFWDQEHQLQLAEGKVIRNAPDPQAEASWVVFEKAILNFQAFHLYPKPQMTTPSQLCRWDFSRSPVQD